MTCDSHIQTITNALKLHWQLSGIIQSNCDERSINAVNFVISDGKTLPKEKDGDVLVNLLPDHEMCRGG